MEWQTAFLFFTTNKIGFLMMIGVLIGIALGGGLKVIEDDLTPRHIMYIGFASEILVQLLEAIGVPLVVVSLTIVFSKLEKGISKLIRLELLLYSFFTKVFTAAIGILLTLVVKPGKGHERWKDVERISPADTLPYTIEEDHILDILRNVFPENWIITSMQRATTKISYNATKQEFSFGLQNTEPLNLLGLISISVVVGISMRMVKQSFQPFLEFLSSLLDVILIIFRWIFFITPVLLISLAAHETLRVGPVFFIAVIGLYISVWLICLVIQIVIFYPLLYVIFVQKNPFLFYNLLRKKMLEALLTSSTREITDSVNAVLKEDCEFNPKLVDYVLPMGLLINKDGSSLQFGISFILIAEYSGIELHLHHYIIITYLTIMGSVAVVGVPQGSLILMTVFLRGANMAVLGICVFFGVDWALNRFVTALNMLGTACGIAILDSLNRDKLDKEVDKDKKEEGEEEEELDVQQTEITEEET